MLLANVIRRIKNDWKGFCMLGLSYVLLSFLLMIPLSIAGAWYLGTWVSRSMFDLSTLDSTAASPGTGLGIAGWVLIGFALVLLAYLLLAAASIAQGGIMGGVAAFAKGEPVSPGRCWQMGVQHCHRFMGLILLGLPLLAAMTAADQMLPGAAPKWMLNGVTGILYVNLWFYPAYLLATEKVGVLQAVRGGLSLLAHRPLEAALSGAIWIGFGAVGSLFTLAARQVLLAGGLPFALSMMLGVWLLSTVQALLQMSYFAERFEAVIRPDFI